MLFVSDLPPIYSLQHWCLYHVFLCTLGISIPLRINLLSLYSDTHRLSIYGMSWNSSSDLLFYWQTLSVLFLSWNGYGLCQSVLTLFPLYLIITWCFWHILYESCFISSDICSDANSFFLYLQTKIIWYCNKYLCLFFDFHETCFIIPMPLV